MLLMNAKNTKILIFYRDFRHIMLYSNIAMVGTVEKILQWTLKMYSLLTIQSMYLISVFWRKKSYFKAAVAKGVDKV